jgi:zinc/manganese transport system permease protein
MVLSATFLYLDQPFAQHALIAAALVALSCGLIGPFVVTRGLAFAVHGTSELAFTGAAAGLLVADNPIGGALVGALVVSGVIGALGVREHERDSTIGVILAFGLGIGVLLLGYYHGFATAATNILFGNVFGVSNGQLLALVAIGVGVAAVMVVVFRPLLFASIDPDVAAARGVPVRMLGIVFLLLLALTVTAAAQVVGTILVLSLAITPAAAAQRWSPNPLVVTVLSVGFALAAAVGGVLASLASTTVKPSVFVTSFSFGLYAISRVAGPLVMRRSRRGGARREVAGARVASA